MVENFNICNDLLRFFIVDTAKESDPGGIIGYLPIMHHGLRLLVRYALENVAHSPVGPSEISCR